MDRCWLLNGIPYGDSERKEGGGRCLLNGIPYGDSERKEGGGRCLLNGIPYGDRERDGQVLAIERDPLRG